MGCQATVWIPPQQRTKLDAKSVDAAMSGYDKQSKAYRMYCPSERKIYISRNVEFNKNPGHSVPDLAPMDTNFFDLIPAFLQDTPAPIRAIEHGPTVPDTVASADSPQWTSAAPISQATPLPLEGPRTTRQAVSICRRR
jgi:hypothetical protein